MSYESELKGVLKCPLGHKQSSTTYNGYIQCDTSGNRIKVCQVCGIVFDVTKSFRYNRSKKDASS